MPGNNPMGFNIALGCPTVGELVSLYARLSEPADNETAQRMINAITQDPEHNIFIEARREGELVAFLRAWKNVPATGQSGKKHGIVYEIVVHGDYRGNKLGKRLLAKLREKTSEWGMDWKDWTGHPNRITTNLDRDLSIIRNLYGIALIFGFQKVAESAYIQFVDDCTAAKLPPHEKHFLLFLLALFLATVGIRFFWAVGNIKRCVLQRVLLLDPPRRLALVLVHFPVLFLHAVMFFFLCRFYQDICLYGVKDQYATGFIAVYSCMLLMNCLWLSFLMYHRTDEGPEWLWIVNNGTFAVLGAVCWAAFRCYGVASSTQLFIISVVFLVNSVIDFVKTRGAYILRDAFGGG